MSDPLSEYHHSVNVEIESAKNRIRSLLHPTIHWGSDGRYKEQVLKEVLSRHVPETTAVQSGFVRLRERTTTEIDVMLTDKTKSTLFRSSDFCITTPNNIKAIIEVKTKQRLGDLDETLDKLANNASLIRNATFEGKLGGYSQCDPWASLFIYESSNIKLNAVLDKLNAVANRDFTRIIQCACIGPNIFVRFWSDKDFTGWEAYELKGLAYSYFISNQIWQDEPATIDSEPWFALKEGKNPYRKARCAFNYR